MTSPWKSQWLDGVPANREFSLQRQTAQEKRMEHLRALMQEKQYDALLTTDSSMLFYFTGFSIEGTLVVTKRRALLFLDLLYKNQVANLKKHFDVSILSRPDSLGKAIATELSHFEGSLVIWPTKTTESTLISLQTFFQKKRRRLVSDEDFFQRIRREKDHKERALIKKACEITQEVMKEAISLCKKGITERALSQEIEKRFLERDAKPSFPTIVAFGKNSAIPHWISTDEKLENQELVLIDCGVVWRGYRSDMTRVIFLKPPSKKMKKAFIAVTKAYAETQQRLKGGIRCASLTKKVNTLFHKAGLGRFILHGIGHGLGLDVHEAPFLETWSNEKLIENDVIAIEPALYIPGVGGIRVENTLVIKDKKAVSFMTLPFYLRITP